MKRKFALLITMIMVLSIFTSCGSVKDENVSKNDINKDAVEQKQEVEDNKKAEDNQKADDSQLADEVEITSDTISFEDAMGEKVSLKKNPKKVICLYNSYLDLWYQSGGKVIGRIKSRSKVPEKAENCEIVGTMTTPNIEKIISMQPDLLILRPGMKGQSEIIPILKENNIPYVAVEYDNFDQYLKTVRIFTALNDDEEAYKKIGLDLKDKIDNLIKKVPTDKKPTVLLMFATTKSVSAKLPNSFVGAMLQDLGTENIAYDSRLTEEKMEIFSMEKVIEKDPDFIFVETMGDVEKIKNKLIKDVESNPAWNSLTAVKEGKYILLDKNLYHYKPNSRYYEAYEGLAKILYPEIFDK